jgi:hypothetical protein
VLTVLTVLTVFSHERIRITLLPASRLNANFDTEHAKERLSVCPAGAG